MQLVILLIVTLSFQFIDSAFAKIAETSSPSSTEHSHPLDIRNYVAQSGGVTGGYYVGDQYYPTYPYHLFPRGSSSTSGNYGYPRTGNSYLPRSQPPVRSDSPSARYPKQQIVALATKAPKDEEPGTFRSKDCPIKYDGTADTRTIAIDFFYFPRDSKGNRTHKVWYRWLREPGKPRAEYWPYLPAKKRAERDQKVLKEIEGYQAESKKVIQRQSEHFEEAFETWMAKQESRDLGTWNLVAREELKERLQAEFPDKEIPKTLAAELAKVQEAQLATRKEDVIELRKSLASFRKNLEKDQAAIPKFFKEAKEHAAHLSYNETNVNRNKLNVKGYPKEVKAKTNKYLKRLDGHLQAAKKELSERYAGLKKKWEQDNTLDTKYATLIKEYRFGETRKAAFAKSERVFLDAQDKLLKTFHTNYAWVAEKPKGHEDWYEKQKQSLKKVMAAHFTKNYQNREHIEKPLLNELSKEIDQRRTHWGELSKEVEEENQRRLAYRKAIQEVYETTLTTSSAKATFASKKVAEMEKKELERRETWSKAFKKKHDEQSARWASEWGGLEEDNVIKEKYANVYASFPRVKTFKDRKYRLRIEYDLTRTVDYVEKPSTSQKIGTKLFRFGKVSVAKDDFDTKGLRSIAVHEDTAVFVVDYLQLESNVEVDSDIPKARLDEASQPNSKIPHGWLAVFQEKKLMLLEKPDQASLFFHKVRIHDGIFEISYTQQGKLVTVFSYRILPSSLKRGRAGELEASHTQAGDPFEDD